MVQADTPAAASGWVSLGRACKLLGVNESTLRRWADDGLVRSFRTPGGHRRFAEDDLRRLQAGPPSRAVRHEEYGALGNLAVAHIRRRLQRGKGHEAPWYSTVDEEGRLRLRPLGRRLADLAGEALQKRTRRGRLVEEARGIGRAYGQELASAGVPLRDAVEAFTFFRRSLDETARQLAHREQLSADESAEAWEHVSALADVVLVELIASFEGSNHAAGPARSTRDTGHPTPATGSTP